MERSFRFLNSPGRRALIFLIATLLMFAVTVSATVAYIITKSDTSDNVFTPPVLRLRIENIDDLVNAGDVPVYVRAISVINWLSTEDEHTILSTKPVLNQDFSMDMHTEGWFLGADGFYYYRKPLAPGESIHLVEAAYQLKEKEGYELRFEILSEAVQAYPAEAIAMSWPAVYIDENGLLQSAISTAGEENR